MSFNNRWVCFTDVNYNLDRLITTLNENEHYTIQSEDTNEYLHHRVNVNDEILESDECEFIYGSYGYQYEKEFRSVPIVNEERMHLGPSRLLRTNIINFWITSNQKILFSKSGPEASIGKDKISLLLFGNEISINTINFRIEELGDAVLNGDFQGMWLSSFRDRQGNIDNGTHYGTNIEDDPMYGETEGCTKNSVGFVVEIENEFRKLRVNRKGTLQILGNNLHPNNIRVFNILSDLEDYILYEF